METKIGSTDRSPPRAPARAMHVIEALARRKGEISLANLSTQLELPKTSLMHLLRALEAAGYVRRVASGYKLASASFQLAVAIGELSGFEEIAADVLEALRDSTGETALLGTFAKDKGYAVYAQRRASSKPVRFAPEVGERRPLYASGVGKVLLAFSAPDQVDSYLQNLKLVPHAARTVRTKRDLRTQLEHIRSEGIAISIDEMADGGSALAAPVFGSDGGVRAALVLAVPTGRFLVNRSRLQAELTKGAAELSGLPNAP